VAIQMTRPKSLILNTIIQIMNAKKDRYQINWSLSFWSKSSGTLLTTTLILRTIILIPLDQLEQKTLKHWK